MDETKEWYRSRTVWGALIAVLAPLLHAAGLNLPGGYESALVDGVTTVAGAVGGLIALYGRLSATQTIR